MATGPTSDPMVADQIIQNTDGSTTTRANMGRLIYEEYPGSHDHRHWHYKRFVRYQLRSVADLSLVRRDNKAGFCLSDADYAPDDYWLVHWVNSAKEICESDYSNDAAAVKIALWPNGYGVAPYFTVKQTVEPFPSLFSDLGPPAGCGVGSIPAPMLPDLVQKAPGELSVAPGPDATPPLTKRAARRYAVLALTQRLHRRPGRARVACRRLTAASVGCSARWRFRSYAYRAKLRIFTARKGTGFERRFDLRVRRTDTTCAARHGTRCSRTVKATNVRFRRGLPAVAPRP